MFGVGGIAVVVPMASRFIGGWWSRYVRIWDAGESGLSKTFLTMSVPELYKCVEELTMCGFCANVVTDRAKAALLRGTHRIDTPSILSVVNCEQVDVQS